MPLFTIQSNYKPTGDQPQAIQKLTASVLAGNKYQTLLGVTGSGKTFTMANIIANTEKPALIIAHNKTLTAQLAQEFAEFFPSHAVHYFVSYYDYYQPEAYVQKTDTYIEKEATINAEIDRLRHAATESLLTRRDVIIVASVSCIYGIGEKAEYDAQTLRIAAWEKIGLENLIEKLIAIQYKRSQTDLLPGTFRIKWDVLEVLPPSKETFLSVEFFGNEIERIREREMLTNTPIQDLAKVSVFPAKHFVTSKSVVDEVIPKIKAELENRIKFLIDNGEPLKAERLKMRVEYDLEMMAEVGYVNGIENYSYYFSGRQNFGEPPSTLMDFFPDGYLTFIDESHMTLPQIRGMYAWDRARKTNLIENGFRLPSAFENRPLMFDEFSAKTGQTVFVSATPSDFEKEKSAIIAEQIIRPTGLLDPMIEIADMEFCVDGLMTEIKTVCQRGERALITTITKKSSEELTEYLSENGIKVRYLHSEIETIDRLEILRDLRLGTIDVIVGVNLLREGLDLPEVSFIGILDAEKIGFLRSTSSLLQIIGRAARNDKGKVVMYTRYDSHTKQPIISSAMHEAMEITQKRRTIQHAYNVKNGITPQTIVSSVKSLWLGKSSASKMAAKKLGKEEKKRLIERLELEMDIAAVNLEFEKAAELRDELLELKKT